MDTNKLIALTGVGIVGYRAYKGKWPWKAEWWPSGEGGGGGGNGGGGGGNGGEGGGVDVADFIVTDISVEYLEESNVAHAVVRNEGEEVSEQPRVVGISVSGEEIGSAKVSLKPGESKTVSGRFNPKSRPRVVSGYIKGLD